LSYILFMKLTVQLQLVPTPAQHAALLDTMQAFNAAASYAACVGFEAGVVNHNQRKPRRYQRGQEPGH
jgi:hypothetical protein